VNFKKLQTREHFVFFVMKNNAFRWCFIGFLHKLGCFFTYINKLSFEIIGQMIFSRKCSVVLFILSFNLHLMNTGPAMQGISGNTLYLLLESQYLCN